jgi:peptidoglycan/LPS O-acetylase OafA/YrhL
MQEIFDLVMSIVTYPQYYTGNERTWAVLANAIAVLSGFVVSKAIPNRWSRVSAIAVLLLTVVAFVVYVNIANAGGMFWWQTFCRAVIVGTLAFCLGATLTFSSATSKTSDG